MLKILHKGIHYNAPLDRTGFTGDVSVDASLSSVTSLVSGALATLSSEGVGLADGGAGDAFAGFVINDAAGYFMENKPALASGLLPLSIGPQVVVTDQIVTSETFSIGDKLYLGSGSNKGKVTKSAPTGATANTQSIGIAGSTASASAPELTVVIV